MEAVKNKFKGDQILGMFDFEEVTVHTDASDYAIGAEISQLDKENGDQFYSTHED